MTDSSASDIVSADKTAVAVIVAAMNADDTIGRAVLSALKQPETGQVIVVDDGSSDDTADAARAVDDGTGRLTVIKLEKNKGPSAARNLALEKVTMPWITILDSDDFMDDGRLGRLLEAAGDTYEFVADDLFLVTEGDEYGERRIMWEQDNMDGPVQLTLEYFVRANIPQKGRRRRELGFIKPLMKTSRLRDLGLKYDETMRLSEDFDLYCRLLASGAPALLTAPMGYIAVRRPDSLSGNHNHLALKQVYLSAIDLEGLEGISAEEQSALSDYRTVMNRRYRWPWLIHAVKERKFGEIADCFRTSPDVIAHLFGKLFETGLGKLSPSR